MSSNFDLAKTLFLEGTSAFSNGNLELAELKLSESLRLVPDRQSTKHNLARLYTVKANTLADELHFDDALKYYNAAIEHDDDCALAWSNKGALLSDHFNLVEQAIDCFKRAIKLEPGYVDAFHNLGLAFTKQKKFQDALECYDEALRINPDSDTLWIVRGNLLCDLRRYEEALASCKQAIELKSDCPDAWVNHGNVLAGLKRYDEALTSCERAIQINPNCADAWVNYGNAFLGLNRHDEAQASYQRALEITPDLVTAWYNRGILLTKLGRHSDALASYQRVLELSPNLAMAWYNRGALLMSLKRHEEALASYDKAIELAPDYAEAWSNRGTALNGLRRYSDALASYERALGFSPDLAMAWYNQGNTLGDLKRHEEALASYERAIEFKPDYAEAWSNRGNALNDLKRHEEALASYAKAIGLKPDIDFALDVLIHTQMITCQWANLDSRLKILETEITKSRKAFTPFPILGLFDSPGLQKSVAEIYVKEKFTSGNSLGVLARRPRRERIRIGYFSMDFREHPVSHLIVELIELHDRRRFEVFGFSFGINTQDPMRQRLEKSFDKFLDVKDLSDAQITQLSRELEMDIAIDLGGHTKDSRPQIFTERAAPIQISYLGYPGTWGAQCMDYLIGDKVVITDSNCEHFFEKIIFLPNQFQVNPSYRSVASSQKSRTDYGLPEKSFVFCCFNNNWKIISGVFYQWIRILQKVPQSVLWLYADNPTSARNLREETIKHGLSPDRVIFAGSVAREKYLEQYKFADLFLDTRPYNAGTTASDALWVGLPVLTQAGKSFASRMAASLLANIGLSELIANTEEEYEALAVEFASNPEKLANIRAKLNVNKLNKPLFNTRLFVKHIESAYQEAYERYQNGLPIDHIHVNPNID